MATLGRITPVLRIFDEALTARDYRYAKPGMKGERQPWGSLEVTVTDPFHNQLTFFQNA